jgi:hypothetical protein
MAIADETIIAIVIVAMNSDTNLSSRAPKFLNIDLVFVGTTAERTEKTNIFFPMNFLWKKKRNGT